MNNNKNLYAKLIPVMLCFFAMGFVDLVGIASNYVKADLDLTDSQANVFPSLVFFWFLIFSVPTGVLMNKIGRKKTVLLSLIITFASLLIPVFGDGYTLMLISFSLLGIGNALMQTSLNPLLSNIMLNELDKELERRGLPFVRYADDSMIFCKSRRAAMRVKESITRFIENTLYLKVNKEKTVVSYVRGVKYLGYSFYVMKGKCQLTVHPKSKAKMKSRLKELTSRSNGWGYAKRKQKLKEYIRGWVGYYHLANMKRLLLETDEWLRRRIRMCIWKAWKKVKTKVANLIKCGISKYKAYEWGNTRKGYWRIADSYILHRAITKEHLCRAGYATLMDAYLEWYPK